MSLEISELFPRTARLTSEPVSKRHREFFVKLFSSKLVHQRMGTIPNWSSWISTPGLESWITDFFNQIITTSNYQCFIWYYKIFPIGISGYYNRNPEKFPNISDIIYFLHPEFWNQNFELEIINELSNKSNKHQLYISALSKKDLDIIEKAGFVLTDQKFGNNQNILILKKVKK